MSIINELIVVEGKNDAHAIRRALGTVDVIWTEGFGLTEEKLKLIEQMAQRQGVIICTDPDFVGQQIRDRITKRVPNAQHVYLTRSSAMNAKGNDIGWENASAEDIQKAFEKILQEKISTDDSYDEQNKAEEIDLTDLLEAGLIGQEGSAHRRSEVGKILGIGDTNAKQFIYRANRFGISKQELIKAIHQVEKIKGEAKI